MAKVAIKRVYEPHEKGDGSRVLIDRVWPRGITKEKLSDALWLKDVAPSTELRKWFGHDLERWREFRTRYRAELTKNSEAVAKLRALAKREHVTLLYAAKDEEHNQAVVLAEYLNASDAK